MTKAARQASTAIGSFVAAALAFVGMPIVLIAAARARFGSANPLHGIDPPWRWQGSELSNAVSEPLQDDAVVNLIIRGSITIIWIALAVIAVSTIAEIAHMVRHRGLPVPHVRGLGWAQGVSRFIAIGVIAILPTVESAHAATASSLVDSSTVRAATIGAIDEAVDTSDRRAWAPTHEAPPTETNSADAHHVVAQGESVWQIAERLAGDDDTRTMAMANAILDANLGRTMNDGQRFTNPALIRPGWQLIVPGVVGSSPADLASTESVDSSTVPVGAASSADDAQVSYVVVEGDTLSEIAAEQLDDPDGWDEIFRENEGRTMVDGRTFDDPNLIVPGWTLDIPRPDPDPEPPVDSHDPADPVVPVDESTGGSTVGEPGSEAADPSADLDEEIGSDPGLDTDSGTGSNTDPAVEPESTGVPSEPTAGAPPSTPPPSTTATTSTPMVSPAPAATTPPTTPPPSTTTTSLPPVADPGDAGAPDTDLPESPAAPSPIRIEHAAMLAAGVLTLVGVRRLRRLRSAMPRARVPEPRPDVSATERRLRSLQPGEGAARLDIALRAAAHQLVDTDAQIGMVHVGDDGRLTLRLTSAAQLDAPWTGVGLDWELPPTVPIELLASDARLSGNPCLSLVTIGYDTDGDTVMIDLEAAGITAVEARGAQADEIVRAIAAGLASSLSCEVVHLITAGLGTDCLLGHPNAHQESSVNRALDAARSLAGTTIDNERGTFELRSRRTGGEMWEPALVLFGSSDKAAEQVAVDSLPAPGHGLGLVASVEPGELPTSGARIVAHADRWELLAFGARIEIEPVGMTHGDVSEIVALLTDAEMPVLTEPHDAIDHAEPVDLPFHALTHEIVVGLLGGVEIHSRSGEPGEFERSKTVELIAWLATHRDRATRSNARTALWELDVRDATFANVVSEARRALGRLVDPPEGEEWLARTLNESLPLHDLVITDADLVRQRLEHARLAAPSHAIDVLRPAVEMIREMPFAGTSYLWPDADGITSDLVLLATTVTSELAAHALSIGDTETVFWSTGHGLRVLPGHEELIALRMRAHARAGDLAGVRAEWESYERVIVADAWSDGEPAPKLLELRRELLSTPTA